MERLDHGIGPKSWGRPVGIRKRCPDGKKGSETEKNGPDAISTISDPPIESDPFFRGPTLIGGQCTLRRKKVYQRVMARQNLIEKLFTSSAEKKALF